MTTLKQSASHCKLWLTCVRGLDLANFTKPRHRYCKIGKLASNYLAQDTAGYITLEYNCCTDKRSTVTGILSRYTVHSLAYELTRLASRLRGQ